MAEEPVTWTNTSACGVTLSTMVSDFEAQMTDFPEAHGGCPR